MLAFLLALLAPAEGRPLFHWGGRSAAIVADATGYASNEARVSEVHAALDEGGLVLRFSFDRPVREASTSPEGAPVSGRVRAVLYLDTDDDRATGFDQGPDDLRTGSDQRLEVGVMTVAADEEEARPAAAVVTVTLASLARDGRRHTLWRADDEALPAGVSAHGEWIEIRVPAEKTTLSPSTRLILAAGDRNWVGRLGVSFRSPASAP